MWNTIGNTEHEDLSRAWKIKPLLTEGNVIVDPFPEGGPQHGTAVLGQLVADNDNKGVTGIRGELMLESRQPTHSFFGYQPANAILMAVADAEPGDVILIEQQTSVCDKEEYGPLEWHSSVFDAIQTATAVGHHRR